MDSGTSKEVIHKISENLNKESTAAIVRTLLKLHKYGGTTEDKLVDTLVIDENVPVLDAKVIVQSVLMAGVEFGAIVKVPDIVYKLDDEFYSFLVDYYSQNYERNIKILNDNPKSNQLFTKTYGKNKKHDKKLTGKRQGSYIEERRRNYKYKVRKRRSKKVKCKRRCRRKKIGSNKKENKKGGFWSTFWNFKQPRKKLEKRDTRYPIAQVQNEKSYETFLNKAESSLTMNTHSSYELIKPRKIKSNMDKTRKPYKNIDLNSNTSIIFSSYQLDKSTKSKYWKNKKNAGSHTCIKTDKKKESETEILAAFHKDKNYRHLLGHSTSRIIEKIKKIQDKQTKKECHAKYNEFMTNSVSKPNVTLKRKKPPEGNIFAARTMQFHKFMNPFSKECIKYKSTPKLLSNSISNRIGHHKSEIHPADKMCSNIKQKTRYQEFIQPTCIKKKFESQSKSLQNFIHRMKVSRNGAHSTTKVCTKQETNSHQIMHPLCSKKSIVKKVPLSKINKNIQQITKYHRFMHSTCRKKHLKSIETSKTTLQAFSNRVGSIHRDGTHSTSKIFNKKVSASNRHSRSRTKGKSISKRSRRTKPKSSIYDCNLDTLKLQNNSAGRKVKSDSVLVIPEKAKVYAKSFMKMLPTGKSLSKLPSETKNTSKQTASYTKGKAQQTQSQNKEPPMDNNAESSPLNKGILESTTLPVGPFLSSMGMGDMKNNWENIKFSFNNNLLATKKVNNRSTKRTKGNSKRRRKISRDKTKRDRKNYAEVLKGRKKGPYSKKSEERKIDKKKEGSVSPKANLNAVNKNSDFGKFYNSDRYTLEKLLKTKNQTLKNKKSLEKTELSPRCITNALEEWCRLKKRLRKRAMSKTEVNLNMKRRRIYSDNKIALTRLSPPSRKRKKESYTSFKSKDLAPTLRKKRKVNKELHKKTNSATSFSSLPATIKNNQKHVNKIVYSETSFLSRNHAGVQKRKGKPQHAISKPKSLRCLKSKTPTYFFPFLRNSKRLKLKKDDKKYSSAYKNQNLNQSGITPAYHSLKRMLRRLF